MSCPARRRARRRGSDHCRRVVSARRESVAIMFGALRDDGGEDLDRRAPRDVREHARSCARGWTGAARSSRRRFGIGSDFHPAREAEEGQSLIDVRAGLVLGELRDGASAEHPVARLGLECRRFRL